MQQEVFSKSCKVIFMGRRPEEDLEPELARKEEEGSGWGRKLVCHFFSCVASNKMMFTLARTSCSSFILGCSRALTLSAKYVNSNRLETLMSSKFLLNCLAVAVRVSQYSDEGLLWGTRKVANINIVILNAADYWLEKEFSVIDCVLWLTSCCQGKKSDGAACRCEWVGQGHRASP